MPTCRRCEVVFDRLNQGEYIGVLAETCNKCLDKITKRQSYKMFREIYVAIRDDPDTVLELVHKHIDLKNGYGSQRNSDAALESLEIIKAEMQ